MTNSRSQFLSLVCLALTVSVGEDAFAEGSAAESRPVENLSAELVLAQASGQLSAADHRFQEGAHFARLMPPYRRTDADDEVVEVAEVFCYCSEESLRFFHSRIVSWVEQAPPNVRFVRIPWTGGYGAHTQIYYTHEYLVSKGVMDDSDVFHSHVFNVVHDNNRSNILQREEDIQRFFARFGVDEATFGEAWNSFHVATKKRRAQVLNQEYGVSRGTLPIFIVNGKYLTSQAFVRDPDVLFELIDELVARESAR